MSDTVTAEQLAALFFRNFCRYFFVYN